MWSVRTIRHHLDELAIKYTFVELPPFFNLCEAQQLGNIPFNSVVSCHLLHDQYGIMMAIIPACHKLNMARLRQLLRRDLNPVSDELHKRIFKGIQTEFIPPFGDGFGVKTVISDEINQLRKVYFSAGDNVHLFQVALQDFLLMQKNASLMTHISIPIPDAVQPTIEPSTNHHNHTLTTSALIEQLARIDKLPPMPEIAMQILRVNANPYAHANDLTSVIARDPSLSAQILRYARSPIYGYGDRVSNLDIAIRLLGHEMVTDLAFGIAMCKPFRIPHRGPLGLTHYWRHSLHCATLMQAVSKELPRELRPQPGLAYLCGLLHNFGHLLLGHLFPEKFAELIHQFESRENPAQSSLELEIFGFTHSQISSALFSQWGLPDEIVACAGNHHAMRYHGPHANYVRLLHICNDLLHHFGLTMHERTEEGVLPSQLIQSLHLDEERLLEITEALMNNTAALDALAQQLAA